MLENNLALYAELVNIFIANLGLFFIKLVITIIYWTWLIWIFTTLLYWIIRWAYIISLYNQKKTIPLYKIIWEQIKIDKINIKNNFYRFWLCINKISHVIIWFIMISIPRFIVSLLFWLADGSMQTSNDMISLVENINNLPFQWTIAISEYTKNLWIILWYLASLTLMPIAIWWFIYIISFWNKFIKNIAYLLFIIALIIFFSGLFIMPLHNTLLEIIGF